MTYEARELTAEARLALQAFRDMTASKSRYFDLLQLLNEKYKSGGAPGIAENLQLEKLLKEHDKNVQAFNTAMASVQIHTDRQQLIKMMSELQAT